MENQFYGDRSGQFVDPWGHKWNVASHVEEVSEEEMGRRMAEMQAQQH
jgi:PhnB protein